MILNNHDDAVTVILTGNRRLSPNPKLERFDCRHMTLHQIRGFNSYSFKVGYLLALMIRGIY